MTNDSVALLGMAVAIAIGAVSPGPSFITVARTAMTGGHTAGLATAVGLGLGALVFAALTLWGLGALLAGTAWWAQLLRGAGGLYLLYLGLQMWRSAGQPLAGLGTAAAAPLVAAAPTGRHVVRGFATQMSNPKTAVVYASVFAAFVPPAPTTGFMLTVVLGVALIEGAWYALVATGLSAARSRRVYLRCRPWLDRMAGTVMGGLGLRLASQAAGG